MRLWRSVPTHARVLKANDREKKKRSSRRNSGQQSVSDELARVRGYPTCHPTLTTRAARAIPDEWARSAGGRSNETRPPVPSSLFGRRPAQLPPPCTSTQSFSAHQFPTTHFFFLFAHPHSLVPPT
ncbi:uncharacterized protein BCR38DRAFT_212026 [Pseudomassariella vexata]|uniref:Uncharacterized protein n=1 Tax=Pseudomassariella vexata TaxID=1141098 RepID=A0A1Y2DYD7_9PEZI|nr:uncharacterized protein BCR38DRAFT_212026 [Pseudomassariella vexata]ORY64320.1 hypothetical protein BCR38DRAFT_212026 [Pseudomassariella vexata]